MCFMSVRFAAVQLSLPERGVRFVPGPLTQHNKRGHISVLPLGKYSLFTDIWGFKDRFFFKNAKFLSQIFPPILGKH